MSLPQGWIPLQSGVDFSKIAFPPRTETKGGGMPRPQKSTTTVEHKDGLKIKRDSLTTICGIPGSGKTNLLRQIVYENARDYNIITLLNPDMSENQDTDVNDYSWLHPDFKCNEQDKFTERINEMKDFLKANKKAHGLLILDDCLKYFKKNWTITITDKR